MLASRGPPAEESNRGCNGWLQDATALWPLWDSGERLVQLGPGHEHMHQPETGPNRPACVWEGSDGRNLNPYASRKKYVIY